MSLKTTYLQALLIRRSLVRIQPGASTDDRRCACKHARSNSARGIGLDLLSACRYRDPVPLRGSGVAAGAHGQVALPHASREGRACKAGPCAFLTARGKI